MAPKKGKKGKKQIIDPFTKKEWYEVRAPNMFTKRNIGQTVVTKSSGNKLASDSLMGRVFTVSLGDLKENSEELSYRKFKLIVEDVQGKQCLTNFHGMDMTTDKLRSLVRKWQTLIEASVDVKTTDGYLIRMFCIGFTTRQRNQTRKTSYAQSAQVKNIRRKMIEIMNNEASSVDLKTLVTKFINEKIGNLIRKECEFIYPLQNVYIRKVKMLRAPKVDLGKLVDIHGGVDAISDMGQELERLEQQMVNGPAAAAAPAEEESKDE